MSTSQGSTPEITTFAGSNSSNGWTRTLVTIPDFLGRFAWMSPLGHLIWA